MSRPASEDQIVTWAGTPFLPLYPHDGRLFHVPGLYAFVSRDASGARTLLWADQSDCIARAARIGHPLWRAAVGQGFNELHLCLRAGERIDRLQLLARIVRHEPPRLGADAAATLTPWRPADLVIERRSVRLG